MNTEDPAIVIDDPIRKLAGDTEFGRLLRDDDELTKALAWRLAHEAAPDTALDVVVDLARNVAADFYKRTKNPPTTPELIADAAQTIVGEMRKVWADKGAPKVAKRMPAKAARPKSADELRANRNKLTKRRAKAKAARKAKRSNRK